MNTVTMMTFKNSACMVLGFLSKYCMFLLNISLNWNPMDTCLSLAIFENLASIPS